MRYRSVLFSAAIWLICASVSDATGFHRTDRQWERLQRRIQWKDEPSVFQGFLEKYRTSSDKFKPLTLEPSEHQPLPLDTGWSFERKDPLLNAMDELLLSLETLFEPVPLPYSLWILDRLWGRKERFLAIRMEYFDPLYKPRKEDLSTSWSDLVAIGSLDAARQRDPNWEQRTSQDRGMDSGLDFEVTAEELPGKATRIWIID